ncbi:MAG: hypothetical protein F4Y68_15770 [Boseongicola sp. SB0665_bin_10]|nr:hypothetical protein [Boseongicola sp. SB0665_bin_10]
MSCRRMIVAQAAAAGSGGLDRAPEINVLQIRDAPFGPGRFRLDLGSAVRRLAGTLEQRAGRDYGTTG